MAETVYLSHSHAPSTVTTLADHRCMLSLQTMVTFATFKTSQGAADADVDCLDESEHHHVFQMHCHRASAAACSTRACTLFTVITLPWFEAQSCVSVSVCVYVQLPLLLHM